ncbi:hypothetical protein MPH_06085 [Macrophomina phaseolina MS6]|uniref:Uncharacterized protein n=1 Tax=Macrophomina phaseolina (strain MS6) TaxID=1126212 RepID=K2S2G6_MACPH|nr:hypothetical protein MPH_06085 [Macrophomina phaseolina MS6]
MLPPTVLHPVSLPDFVRYLVDHHATPTNLVVCSSRADFEKHLLYCLESARDTEPLASAASQYGGLGNRDQDQAFPAPQTGVDQLLVPTLDNLFTTSTIRLTFCASLETLRAYLSSLTVKSPDRPTAPPSVTSTPFSRTDAHPILALLSPIALHRETTSFSAQGLSRTLAIAVEAAAYRKQKLIFAECSAPPHLLRGQNDAWMEGHDVPGEEAMLDTEAGGGREGEHEVADEARDLFIPRTAADTDPWAEKLSILNVTTKSFGIGDKGWAGRTVTARSVAERWCRFERPRVSTWGREE